MYSKPVPAESGEEPCGRLPERPGRPPESVTALPLPDPERLRPIPMRLVKPSHPA